MNWKALITFLAINFGGLYIGAFLMGDAVTGEWYSELDKAPWTPPGWVFGAAWTTIMICFSVYMARWWDTIDEKKSLIGLFIPAWICNVIWNFIFFNQQMMGLGLVIIIVLTILVTLIGIRNISKLKLYSFLILPYFIWMCIATSLNAYAYLYN